ncbi:hypothetical protein ACFVGY_30765 [Streptomyces sp. NPDC127106]|uniref:hypothetical protein n=1 Tax=Streptomyces sp. NPDC127106 TaxID=3345360 RepID=UPI003635F1BB
MPRRNAHQKAARELQAAEGIGYQEALNRVRAAAEPATEPPAPVPAAVAYVLEPTSAEAALGITAEELGVRALPSDATPAQRAHAEAVWRPETDPAKPCRCSGRNCHHGAPCAEEDYEPPCTGRMVHVDRHPGSMFELTAWYDVHECDGCGERFETTVMLPGLPWGEVRNREEVDGERYTGVMGEDRVTVIYSGIRHPNFPDRTPGEGDEDEHDLDPDDYPTPEDHYYGDEGQEDEDRLANEDQEEAPDYFDDGPEGDLDSLGAPPVSYDDGPGETELGRPSRVLVVDHDSQPTAADWSSASDLANAQPS